MDNNELKQNNQINDNKENNENEENNENKKSKKWFIRILIIIILILILLIALSIVLNEELLYLGKDDGTSDGTIGKDDGVSQVDPNTKYPIEEDKGNVEGWQTEEGTGTGSGSGAGSGSGTGSGSGAGSGSEEDDGSGEGDDSGEDDGSGEDDTPGDNEEPELPEDVEEVFSVHSENKEWSSSETLKFFENEHYYDTVIAPGVSGQYTFAVKNSLDTDTSFQLQLSDTNLINVHLHYKIKIDGNYLIEEWTKIPDIVLPIFEMAKKSDAIFTLEWKWIDAENDTEIGESADSVKYKIQILISNDEIVEK